MNQKTVPMAPASVAAAADFQVEVKRSAYGIPHITAEDWASLGYG